MRQHVENQGRVSQNIHLLSASVATFTLFRDLMLDLCASVDVFTLFRDLMLDLCIMLLLRVSPRIDALIELRRLLRSNVRKTATVGTSTSTGFFLKKKIYKCDFFSRNNMLLSAKKNSIRQKSEIIKGIYSI